MARISSPSFGVTVWSAAMQAAHAVSSGCRLDGWTWASRFKAASSSPKSTSTLPLASRISASVAGAATTNAWRDGVR